MTQVSARPVKNRVIIVRVCERLNESMQECTGGIIVRVFFVLFRAADSVAKARY